MPNRVNWDPRFSVGHEDLDTQHKHFLDQCNALADCLDAGNEEEFDRVFKQLMDSARAHFAGEEALLDAQGYSGLDALRDEREEFEYLAAEIVTTENFDREELQTFLSLWWAGHVMGAVRNYRDYLA